MKAGTILIVLLACLLIQCDTNDESTEACFENNAPELIAVHLVVQDMPVYEGMDIEPGDKVYFYLDISDKDCNLQGGDILLEWNGAPAEAVAQIHGDQSCQAVYPDQPLGFFKTLSESGMIPFSLRVEDQCIRQSNAVSGTLDVAYSPRVLSATWSPSAVSVGDGSTLRFSVCDPDNDLLGGEIMIYKHGNSAPLFPPYKWSQVGVGPETLVNDCQSPKVFGIRLTPLKSICVDIHVTDQFGHGSGRYENVCILVE